MSLSEVYPPTPHWPLPQIGTSILEIQFFYTTFGLFESYIIINNFYVLRSVKEKHRTSEREILMSNCLQIFSMISPPLSNSFVTTLKYPPPPRPVTMAFSAFHMMHKKRDWKINLKKWTHLK